MKKLTFLAMAGATALAGITLLGCSDKDELVDVNPTYDPENGTVTTQFAFNVSTSNTPLTRMDAGDVQANVTSASQFRGITATVLMPFQTGVAKDGKHISDVTGLDVGKNRVNLSTVLTSGQIGKDTEKSHRVLELALPVQTNQLLFYGKALGNSYSTADKMKYGMLDFNISNQPASTTISLEPRIQDENNVVVTDEFGNAVYNSDGTPKFTKVASVEYKQFFATEHLMEMVINRLIHNGLFKESESTGGAQERDFSYNIWWPEKLDNFELVEVVKYGNKTKQVACPKFTHNGKTYIIMGCVKGAGVDADKHIMIAMDTAGGTYKDYLKNEANKTYEEGGYHVDKYILPVMTILPSLKMSGDETDDLSTRHPYVKLVDTTDTPNWDGATDYQVDEISFSMTPKSGTSPAVTKMITDIDTYQYWYGEVDWREYGEKLNLLLADKAEATTGHAGKLVATENARLMSADENLSPLGEILGKAYNEFVSLKHNGGDYELRAGSATAVARMVMDLWNVVINVRDATPTSVYEAISQVMAARLIARFNTYFVPTYDAGSTKVSSLKWKSPKAIYDLLTKYQGLSATEVANITAIIDDDDDSNLNNFPANLNLPTGCTQLIFTSVDDDIYNIEIKGTKSKIDKVDYHSEALTTSTSGFDINNPAHKIDHYTYPAELAYFGNSPVNVTDISHEATEYPEGIGNWLKAVGETGSWTSDWSKGKHVLISTRSAAMQYNVQYGTSLLEYTVAYNASNNKLEDNNQAVNGEPAKTFDVAPAVPASGDDPGKSAGADVNAFELTGILIGGQPTVTGWNYLAKSDATYDYTIYDALVTKNGASHYGTAIKTIAETATPNYVLALDNYTTETEQKKVKIALEFRNCSGRDFWGLFNMVRDGGTFYIVGELDPATGVAPSWDSTNPALPPYNASTGATEQIPRVFIQDYKTTAHFVLNENSLKNAYVTVPDLRSAQLSFGLSVDLTWQTGMVFNNVILGGEVTP